MSKFNRELFKTFILIKFRVHSFQTWKVEQVYPRDQYPQAV